MLLTPAPFGADQAFWPGAKTLPQGQFICPEDVKSNGVPARQSRVGNSVKIPKVLQPYMGGKEVLIPKK